MANELVSDTAEISHVGNKFEANKKAMARIKSLPNDEFEKEISSMDYDMQTFLRLARNH